MNKAQALDNLKRELPGTQTLQEFLDTCAKHFDFNQKLGVIAKATLIHHISKVIDISGAKPK